VKFNVSEEKWNSSNLWELSGGESRIRGPSFGLQI